MTPEQMTDALQELSASIERHFGKGTPAVLVVRQQDAVSVLHPLGVDALSLLSEALLHETGKLGPPAQLVKAKPRKDN